MLHKYTVSFVTKAQNVLIKLKLLFTWFGARLRASVQLRVAVSAVTTMLILGAVGLAHRLNQSTDVYNPVGVSTLLTWPETDTDSEEAGTPNNEAADEENKPPDSTSPTEPAEENPAQTTTPRIGSPQSNVNVSHLTSGGGTYKPNPTTSTTATIQTPPHGKILIWVGTAVGDNNIEAPLPTVEGLGVTFEVIQTVQKKDSAPRRLTLLAASLPANALTGSLKISYPIPVAHWAWEVDHVSTNSLHKITTRTDGGFLTYYSVDLSPSSKSGNAVIGGLIAGTNKPINTGAGLAKLGQGNSTFISVVSGWTTQSRSFFDFDWSVSSGEPAHCAAIVVEFSP